MSKKFYYLTTPLYYVNARPHIGHAYTNILCDSFARYQKFRGRDVFFLTGTDEHGTKIEKIARENKQTPKDYVDQMVPTFKELWENLGIHYDYFIRTTDAAHKRAVQQVLTFLEQKGDIYKASYKGWYCTPCESFWTELQLSEGKCPDCRREVQELSEDNYFFRLSKYQPWLMEYIQNHPEFILPENRRNEILGFLRQPLEDLCITRPRARLSWGIDFPGSPEHVVYVWFDALVNYISAVKYGLNDGEFERYWPADLHVIGKDILRQHVVFWPIMLHACELALPRTVLVHGWWTMAGAKVSKSVGNIVDPVELTRIYGVDAFRYFLLHEVTVGFDGAYSESLLRERYTSDLANDLGNLWFRFGSMLERYFGGAVPKEKNGEAPLLEMTFKAWDNVVDAMEKFDPRKALEAIWQVVTKANQFVEEKKPWILAKDESKKKELAETLGVLAECLAHLGYLLLSFLPETGRQMLKRMGLPEKAVMKDGDQFKIFLVPEGTKVVRGDALFPKLEEV